MIWGITSCLNFCHKLALVIPLFSLVKSICRIQVLFHNLVFNNNVCKHNFIIINFIIVAVIKSIYIYIYKQRHYVGEYKVLPCGAFLEILFIQFSTSTKFVFILKYQFIELTNRVNACINYLLLCIVEGLFFL